MPFPTIKSKPEGQETPAMVVVAWIVRTVLSHRLSDLTVRTVHNHRLSDLTARTVHNHRLSDLTVRTVLSHRL
jgi:hypothetical protein